MREWLDWMKPMPPMSAARLKHHSMPSHAVLQLPASRRSRLRNSWQKVDSDMYSFSFQSTARIHMPSSLRRFARCEAMKPPAPVMTILVPLGKSLVKQVSETGGSTMLREAEHAARTAQHVQSRTLAKCHVFLFGTGAVQQGAAR